MTTYASKTPRDLNHDPLPYVWNGHHPTARKRDDCRTTFRVSPDYEYDPRPEFNHVQHNEPNPILGIWRATTDGDMRGWGVWLALAAHDMIAHGTATPEQIDHARRVLERLASLAA